MGAEIMKLDEHIDLLRKLRIPHKHHLLRMLRDVIREHSEVSAVSILDAIMEYYGENSNLIQSVRGCSCDD